MGEVVLLRKLTEKSKIGFGDYKDYTVQNLMDLHKAYILRGYYYTLSKISYSDSVLESLMIADMQIDKPGTDKESYKFIKEYFNGLRPIRLIELSNKRYKKAAKKRLEKIARDSKFTKGSLERWNHGHK